MKSGPAGRAVRDQGPGRGAGRRAVRAADVHRQSGRGDRLAYVHAAHPGRGRARRRLLRPRMRPGQRRHRVGPQGDHGHPDHGRGPRRARRRGAREGPQRDPRGEPDRARPARPQRPLAGRHVQRRGHRRRDPPERRRRNAAISRWTCGPPTARASTRSRPRSARSLAATRGPRHDRRQSTSWHGWRPMEKLARSGRLVEHAQAVARRLGFEVHDTVDRRRVGRQHDVGDGRPEPRRPRADRRQRPRARPSTSTWTRSCPGRRCSPACCWPSPATRRSSPGATAPDDRDPATPSRGAAAHLVGRPVRAASAATAGRSSSATRAGWPARRTSGPDGVSTHPGDAAAQARATLEIIGRALAEGGFGFEDVVRTRMFVTDVAVGDRGGRRPRRDLRRDPAGRDAGRRRGAHPPEPARRDRSRGAPRRLGRG